MPPAGPSLLPALLLGTTALLAGDRFAERGPREPVALERREPAVVAPSRSIVLHGFFPARMRAPLVLIAASTDAAPDRYDELARHLASHGLATLVVAREKGESWPRYADALALAARQLPLEARLPDHPWSRILAPAGVALVADGDAEAAAARTAANVPEIGALVLIDGDDAGCALPWLERVRAPFLYVGASRVGALDEAGAAAGLRSLAASGASGDACWHVRIDAEGPLLDERTADADKAMAPAVRDLHALVARFLEAELGAERDVVTSLRDLARLGEVARDCRRGAAAARRPPSKR